MTRTNLTSKLRKFYVSLGALAAAFAMTLPANASDAATSATAGGRTNGRNGTATATAQYQGDIGFARTDSQSGRVNIARGVAVGVDEDGVSLSVSNAIAPRGGAGLATNFNMTIGRDGQVNTSGGVAVADGPLHRTVSAGGATGPNGATSFASGDSDRFGRADARTWSESSRVATPVRVIGRAPVLDRGRDGFRSEVGYTTAKRVTVVRDNGWGR